MKYTHLIFSIIASSLFVSSIKSNLPRRTKKSSRRSFRRHRTNRSFNAHQTDLTRHENSTNINQENSCAWLSRLVNKCLTDQNNRSNNFHRSKQGRFKNSRKSKQNFLGNRYRSERKESSSEDQIKDLKCMDKLLSLPRHIDCEPLDTSWGAAILNVLITQAESLKTGIAEAD